MHFGDVWLTEQLWHCIPWHHSKCTSPLNVTRRAHLRNYFLAIVKQLKTRSLGCLVRLLPSWLSSRSYQNTTHSVISKYPFGESSDSFDCLTEMYLPQVTLSRLVNQKFQLFLYHLFDQWFDHCRKHSTTVFFHSSLSCASGEDISTVRHAASSSLPTLGGLPVGRLPTVIAKETDSRFNQLYSNIDVNYDVVI
jgi:hypothetical protein